MKKKLIAICLFLIDYLSAGIAWTIFYSYRKIYLEPLKFGHEIPLEFGQRFWMGLCFIPIFWVLLYTLMGNYNNVLRRSRLKELGQTILISIIGVIIIFFALLLDDFIVDYKTYYISFLSLLIIHFLSTFLPRFICSSIIVGKVHTRKIGFNTILLGSQKKALETFLEINSQKKSSGNFFKGYVCLSDSPDDYLMKNHLPQLGSVKELKNIILKYQIEEVIIAAETSEQYLLGKLINFLDTQNVIIKITPELSDILTGSVKMSAIFDAPLIEIKQQIMPIWQKYIKRLIDIVVSLFVLIALSPLLILLAIIIKLTSKGPVIFAQERIGKYGKPFNIYKFRSMYVNAEASGPALSSKNDNRITPLGKTLRKYRFDELPNFFNVLKGDMSLVGPRPERQFFIDQIIKKAPHYSHLHKVKAGITSWGQVKFGYAENVDEMIQRLKYDLLYIENMSLL